jgi:hypothetical protein
MNQPPGLRCEHTLIAAKPLTRPQPGCHPPGRRAVIAITSGAISVVVLAVFLVLHASGAITPPQGG